MIDWHTIDTALIDMDGTLLDLHYDEYFWLKHLPKRYAMHHDVSLDLANERILSHIKKTKSTLQWYCLDHWSEVMEMDIPKLKHEVKEHIQLRPNVEAFLTRLKELNIQRILVTNSHRKGLDLKLGVTQIDKWLDIIVSSHDYGVPKEKQGFWQKLAREYPFDPDHTVFFDDNLEVLRSAQTFGVKHLVCITKPNSKKARGAPEEFYGLEDFDKLEFL